MLSPWLRTLATAELKHAVALTKPDLKHVVALTLILNKK
jgi:hypothetical protein